MASTETAAAAATNGHGEGERREIEVENPATGRVIGRVPEMDAAEVHAMAQRGRAAQPGWEALGFEGRGRVMRRAQKWVMDNHDRLVETIVSETGKTHEDARIRVLGEARRGLPRRREGQELLALRRGQEAPRALQAARADRRDRAVELPARQQLRRLHPGAHGRELGDPQAE
jgi:acyl-CoA reductase-like NAD-dependent aldehyde dehydrogenase